MDTSGHGNLDDSSARVLIGHQWAYVYAQTRKRKSELERRDSNWATGLSMIEVFRGVSFSLGKCLFDSCLD
jgi:hypothetical protein